MSLIMEAAIPQSDFYTVQMGNSQFTVLKQYKNLQIIGFGGQGIVCSAYDEETKQNVAIKKIYQPFLRPELAKRCYREIILMRLVDHNNIIKLYKVFSPQNSAEELTEVYLVLELMGQNLSQIVHSLELSINRISFLVYQMLCAVRYLHSAGIIHRDLKPSNMVVNELCILKILDFGLARTFQHDFQMTPYVVTRYYRAPEVILELGYSEKVDTWAIGCIMAEMITRDIFFKGSNPIDQWIKITEKLGTPSNEFLNQLSPGVRQIVMSSTNPPVPMDLLFPDRMFIRDNNQQNLEVEATVCRDLLSKLLVIDPVQRFSLDEALSHPFVSQWTEVDDLKTAFPLEFEEYDHSIEEWKKWIFKEISRYNQNSPDTNML